MPVCVLIRDKQEVDQVVSQPTLAYFPAGSVSFELITVSSQSLLLFYVH